jgi:hypothetical protein
LNKKKDNILVVVCVVTLVVALKNKKKDCIEDQLNILTHRGDGSGYL